MGEDMTTSTTGLASPTAQTSGGMFLDEHTASSADLDAIFNACA